VIDQPSRSDAGNARHFGKIITGSRDVKDRVTFSSLAMATR
jgi:hypothetical protein